MATALEPRAARRSLTWFISSMLQRVRRGGATTETHAVETAYCRMSELLNGTWLPALFCASQRRVDEGGTDLDVAAVAGAREQVLRELGAERRDVVELRLEVLEVEREVQDVLRGSA